METEARARGLAGWARGRALGNSVSGRGVAAVRVPSAYTRIAPRSVNAGAHRASAQRAILIGYAAIKNPRIPLNPLEVFFSNRLKTSNCSARFAHARRITHRCPTPFLFDTNKPHKIIILPSALLKTKEKQFSIQYKFTLRDIGLPSEAATSLPLHPEPNRFLRRSRANYLKIEIPFEVNDAANLVCAGSDPALRSRPERPATQH